MANYNYKNNTYTVPCIYSQLETTRNHASEQNMETGEQTETDISKIADFFKEEK